VFLRVVGTEAEETAFITETECILREVRFEAEEILEHRALSMVNFEIGALGYVDIVNRPA
jgi:hypothetical protein